MRNAKKTILHVDAEGCAAMQDWMSEILSECPSSEEDEAAQAELAAMEESSLKQELEDLPEVPKVRCSLPQHTRSACVTADRIL